MSDIIRSLITVMASRVMRACIRVLLWANREKLEDSAEEIKAEEENSETEAAQQTISLITAAHGVAMAHDDEIDCKNFHQVHTQMAEAVLSSGPNKTGTVLVQLSSILGQTMSAEDIQELAMSLAVEDL